MSKFKIGDKVKLKNNFAGFKQGEEFDIVCLDEPYLSTRGVWIVKGKCGVTSDTKLISGRVDINNYASEFELIGSESLKEASKSKHKHYFKDCPYDKVDVYRVLDMFSVTDSCIQHAAKKLLVAGGRGHKDIGRDIQDVIDTLERWKEMRKEEGRQS